MNLTYEQKYHLLFELFQKIRDTLDLDEIMAHILDTIQTVIPYDAAGIFALNQALALDDSPPTSNLIAGMYWRGYDPRPTDDEMLTHGKGIIGHVIASGTSVVAPDVRLDRYYVEGRPETLSEIAVPILRGERTLGALNLESDRLAAYNENDLEVLQFFADAAAIALEKAILHRQLLEKELLDKQLELAKDVQTHLLPMAAPSLPGYDIAGICIPAEEIGGDYYDFFFLPDGRLGIAVADVSGHGIAAALAMSAFRVLLRSHTQDHLGLSPIASAINKQLPESTGGRHFITMVYCVLDPAQGRVNFISCGHPAPCRLQADGGCELLKKNGPAFGIYPEANYQAGENTLAPGEILVLYTDGVVELENPTGQAFGMARLTQAVQSYRSLPARALVQKIIAETQAFSDNQACLDDFTLVVVKRV